MGHTLASLPRCQVTIEAGDPQGPWEWWRAALGHGGINSLPLPERVLRGVSKLKPRLIRIFIQEFFDVYPERGRFDWSKLDPYMDAFGRTGARVVAAICIKPRALFPKVDHAAWQPADPREWQQVIRELVKRYSVEKPIVTHWEIGNETDIGEAGGTPYLIPDPTAYFEFYRTAVQAVLEAFPAGKVGGPASCWVTNEPLPGLAARCRESGTPLDFISWHCYSDDPKRHAAGVQRARELVASFPGKRPELFITEWNKGFDAISVSDLAFDPRRAAIAAASILSMEEAGVDWTFYYHIWDQVCDPRAFAPFFSPEGVRGMVAHWNEVPHRFGLFGVGEEARPQYFLYQMLSRLGDERLVARSDDPDVRVLAARRKGSVSALLVNFNVQTARDTVVTVHFAGLSPGRKRLALYRIDRDRRWSEEALELLPLERREVETDARFRCQVYCPADSVAALVLDTIEQPTGMPGPGTS